MLPTLVDHISLLLRGLHYYVTGVSNYDFQVLYWIQDSSKYFLGHFNSSKHVQNHKVTK